MCCAEQCPALLGTSLCLPVTLQSSHLFYFAVFKSWKDDVCALTLLYCSRAWTTQWKSRTPPSEIETDGACPEELTVCFWACTSIPRALTRNPWSHCWAAACPASSSVFLSRGQAAVVGLLSLPVPGCPAGAVPGAAAAPSSGSQLCFPQQQRSQHLGTPRVPWVPQATVGRRAGVDLSAWFQQESVSLGLTVIQLEGVWAFLF